MSNFVMTKWAEQKSKLPVFCAENESPMIKCSKEEREIYGVDFKKDEQALVYKVWITEAFLYDTEEAVYLVNLYGEQGENTFSNASGDYLFSEKEEAIKFAQGELDRLKRGEETQNENN